MMDFLTQTDNSEKVIVDDIPNAEEVNFYIIKNIISKEIKLFFLILCFAAKRMSQVSSIS